jgi:hypothetical protein
VTDAGEDDGVNLAAAMGGTDDVDALDQREDYEQRQHEPSAGGVGRPTAALPIAQLDALAPAERKRLARKRGLDWPETDDARERLFQAVTETMREGDEQVIDAPTSLGKSYTVAATPWDAPQYDTVTGGRPVVHLHKTRDARDEARETSDAAGVDHFTLKARTEACPVCAGDYDPEAVEGTDREALTVDGQPASEWMAMLCDERGVPLSVAHRYLEERVDGDAVVPCSAETECPAIDQWRAYREGDHALVHATHNFAHVPGLRAETNVVVDEQPDFQADLSTERVRRAIAAYLREIDAPVKTWEQFVTLARYDRDGDAATDVDRERDALVKTMEASEPSIEWYIDTPGAHTMAPALAEAILYGEEQANGRYVGETRFAPPRLDQNARDGEAWNAAYLTVVLDDANEVRTVWQVPDFSPARSVVGLDAHPALPKWQLNTVPWIQREAVLDGEERRLWRRYERGLRVVQVGDATRPLTSGEYFDYDGCEAIVEHLREQYGDDFRTAITASAVEHELRDIMRRAEIERLETMHYGEEKSRNDFAEESVGLVNGCIDPGDGHVVDLLAALKCEATPERADEDCHHCEGDGCEQCDGTGRERAHGRGFDGPDADVAEAILASVRENHVAQAAGRYARSPDDPEATATVFVRTDAMPPGFADVQVPGVAWTYGAKQEAVVEALRESAEPRTARELASTAGCSKKHARETLDRLAEYDDVRAFEGAGAHGATLYADAGVAQDRYVDLAGDGDGSPPRTYGGHYTWQVAICSPSGEGDSCGEATTAADGAAAGATDWREVFNGGDRPPDGAD